MNKIKKLNKLDVALLIALIIYPLTTPYGVAIIDMLLEWFINLLLDYGFYVNIVAGAVIMLWIVLNLNNKFKVKLPEPTKNRKTKDGASVKIPLIED